MGASEITDKRTTRKKAPSPRRAPRGVIVAADKEAAPSEEAPSRQAHLMGDAEITDSGAIAAADKEAAPSKEAPPRQARLIGVAEITDSGAIAAADKGAAPSKEAPPGQAHLVGVAEITDKRTARTKAPSPRRAPRGVVVAADKETAPSKEAPPRQARPMGASEITDKRTTRKKAPSPRRAPRSTAADIGKEAAPSNEAPPSGRRPRRPKVITQQEMPVGSKMPMGSLHRYALALWLLGAVVYGVSTQAFVRATDLFGRQDQADVASTEKPAEKMSVVKADLSPRPDAASGEGKPADTPTTTVTKQDAVLPPATAEQAAAAPLTTDANTPEPTMPEGSAEDDGEWVEVTAGVNMRAGPSSENRILKVQPRGAKLLVVSRDGSWVEVVDPETGQTGWIYSTYTEPAEPS